MIRLFLLRKFVFIGLIIVLFSLTGGFYAHADYSKCSTCHLYGGVWNFTPSNLNYWSDSSVSSYGYGDSVSNAVSKWGAVSNAPIINLAGSESTANIKYYIGENVLDPGVGGETFFYRNYGGTWLDVSNQVPGSEQEYDLAKVVIDHAHIKDLSYFNGSFRDYLLGHESGHALGLNHFEYSPAHSGDHWMKTCQCQLTSPTSVDTAHLQAKYIGQLP